jgi:hypothetical protein
MATVSTDTFQSSANLSLWYKLYTGDSLNLADIPEIISLRWTYFRDNWSTIKRRLSVLAASLSDQDYFRAVVDDLDTFIDQQRLSSVENNPFSGSSIYYRFYPVFDAMLIEQIGITHEERELVNRKRMSVGSFSKNDFLKVKRDITAYRDHLADVVGLADSDYNRIYNRGAVQSRIVPSITDLNLMMVLQDQLSSVNFILANLFAVDNAIDPFALAKLNANNPDLQIGEYRSGYLVRLHFGEDLQGLATRYLRDPNRWIDIAIANGLREPYIDEAGEQIFFLSNGSGSQINVKSVDASGVANINKLYINQFVLIQSSAMPFPSQRLIAGIREIPVSGEIVLTLSGEANLQEYQLADQASIRIFKPNTVNSSQFVLIPTPIPLDNGRQDEVPWFQTSSAADEKKAKIDIAIGEDGTLQLTSSGDIALSYGLANAIQATKLKLGVEQGSNRYHPDFGIVNLVGTTNANDTDAKTLLIDSISAQIQADPRFDRIESLTVERSVSSMAIAYEVRLVVRLAGSNTLIPISFTVAA